MTGADTSGTRLPSSNVDGTWTPWKRLEPPKEFRSSANAAFESRMGLQGAFVRNDLA
jgi:hypothetical protein